MFKRILIPTDAGGFGQEALERGLELAQLMGGEVTLLHALDNPPQEGPAGVVEEVVQESRRRGQEALEQARCQAANRGVVARAVLLEHISPVKAILDEARQHDLIVMATHGRKGIERAMMGSVTDKVVHNCLTPILVVHALKVALKPDITASDIRPSLT